MSIQLAAKHLAAHGRGPDTTLVHMTPGEVASLQALAQQHGGSLSINPQTGLPEAGFLSALLPMAAGAGLAAMGMPAGYAALSVGAASAATNGGDMKKAILNGFSAYTGAGMAGAFMDAGAMGASAATPTTVLEVPPGATSPYALTGSPATSSTANYSLGEPSSYLNKPLPSLVSAAPAQVAQAAAAATPAAQAAQQAAALDSMSMGQRFDALKAGASGTNAMNYIKANPFASLGTATAMLTPDENKTPQKAADTDRGPRAGLSYYPGYGTSLPKPNMQGVEQTYNRPYYAAKGGVTRMATGGITSAPRNQQQLFAEYLKRVSSSGVAAPPPTNKYDWWKSGGGSDTPATPPVETPEEYAARMRLNARGGGGGGMSPEQRAEREADNDKPQPMFNGLSRNEYFSLSPEEQNAVRAQADMDNPKTAAFFNAVKFAASPVKFLYDKLAPPPAASEMQKYIDAADAESRTLTRDRAYEAYGNSIEGVTASDAATTEAQRVANEATNLARMQADTYPSGNFADAPLSSRTDVSGYPLRESELKSFERGLAPAPAPAPAPVAPAPIEGGVVSGAVPLSTSKIVASGKLAGDKPIGDGSFTPADARTPYGEGEGNSKKNEIAAYIQQQEGIAKDYIQSGQNLGFEHPKTIALKEEYNKYNDTINNLYNRVQYTDPTTNDYKTPFVNYTSAAEGVAQTNAALTPAAETNAYGLGYVGKDPTTGLAIGDPRENTNTFNSALPTTNQVFGINEVDPKYKYNFTPAVDFTDENASQLFGLNSSDYDRVVSDLGQYNLGTLAPDALRYSGTGVPNTLKTPDIQNVSEISADPDADKTAESLGIPSAETFAAMIGAPFAQTAALNNGVVSDAGGYYGPLAGYQGGYNPGFGAPTTTSSGRGLAGLTASFGGLGSAWQGVVDRNGNPVLTSQGAAENAFNASPEGIAAENARETQSLLGRYPAPAPEVAPLALPPTQAAVTTVDNSAAEAAARAEAQAQQDARIAAFDASREGSRGGGGGMGGDGGGFSGSGAAAGSSTRADPGANNAVNPGWGSRDAGGGDARGGYLQHGRFDQRMAYGGLSAMPNPYDLGSYSDGGRLLKGPGDGVSDSIPATIGKGRPARLADGEFVIPARIVSEIGNGSTEAGARKLYAMMDRIQAGRKKSVGKGKVAVNSRAYKHLPA